MDFCPLFLLQRYFLCRADGPYGLETLPGKDFDGLYALGRDCDAAGAVLNSRYCAAVGYHYQRDGFIGFNIVYLSVYDKVFAIDDYFRIGYLRLS